MNTGTIFDLVQSEPEGKEGFIQVASKLPEPKDDSFLTTAGEYGKTILKGFAEGALRLGRMMGPLQVGKSEKEIQEGVTQRFEELLPQEEEGYIQKGVRRGLQQLPSMAAFPGTTAGTAVRSIGAGLTGEAIKEVGGPEWLQTVGELANYIGPDITKKLLEKGKHKEIIEAARKFGMTDEQIAPLLQGETKQKWMAALTAKKGKTQKILKSTQEKLGETFDTIKKSPLAAQTLSQPESSNLLNRFAQIAEDMPSNVRNEVAQDFKDLVKRPITGESLMNLWKDLNKSIGPRTKELSLFKQPIREALKNLSPELAKDFEMVNNFYSRYANLAGKLKPTMVSELVRAAESLGLLGGIVFQDFTTVGSILAEQGIKKGAREFLLNPRFQQLGEKFLLALNQNKFGIAKSIAEKIKDESEEEDKNLKMEIPSEEELKKMFRH